MTTASEALSRNLKQVRLLAAIEQLPAKHRSVLQLRYSEGLTTGEIAERVGSTDAAIRVQLSRSLAKLQQLLGET
jgi:RNA polymerase sigma factor (sigma-70 family)